MSKRTMLSLALAGCVLAAGVLAAQARTARIEGAEVTLIEAGSVAPEFRLFGTDLRYHSLSMYRNQKAVAVIFHCNHCPISKRNVDRIVELGNQYQPRGIQFLIINPNPVDKVVADGFEKMRERALEKNFPFPYLYDETQMIAAAYGARRTDHVFVLVPAEDGQWRVVFIGPVDNRNNAPHYLADALEAVLADREIETQEVEASGCTIKYRTAQERVARFGYDPFER